METRQAQPEQGVLTASEKRQIRVGQLKGLASQKRTVQLTLWALIPRREGQGSGGWDHSPGTGVGGDGKGASPSLRHHSRACSL